MRKKKSSEHEDDYDDKHQSEILKAVAQAWLGHSGNSRTTANEFDAHRLNFQSKPSRFKLEAMNKLAAASKMVESANYWDFKHSLWDSYEIVNVSKRLERGLLLDNPFGGLELDTVQSSGSSSRIRRKKKESKNSLRNLFNMMSSRRFNEPGVPLKDIHDTQIDY